MKNLLLLLIITTIISGCQWLGATPDTEPMPTTTDAAETEQTPENYQAYSETALTEVLGNDRRAVLFFKASWCPTCREAEEDILKHSQLLPEDVIILHADYDTEQDLKQRYGVVSQHTYVLLDAQGNAAETWIGGGVDEIIEYVGSPEPLTDPIE